MSYVLQALKKAEAQRERGAVPNLHAQPFGPAAAPDTAGPGGRPSRGGRLLAGVGLLAVAAAVLLAWLFGPRGGVTLRDDATRVAAAGADSRGGVTATTAQPAADRPAPVGSAGPVPGAGGLPTAGALPAAAAPTAPVPAAVIVAPAPPEPLPAPAETRAARRDTPAPTPAAASVERQAGAVRSPDAAAAAVHSRSQTPAGTGVSAAASPAPAASTAAPGRVYRPEELPDDVRRSLPALTIGGAMHAPNPANRMLFVNGQVFRESDTLAPGVTLEEIAPKSAVLQVRGYRVRLNY